MLLVDTNIPLRLAQRAHPHYQPAFDALALLTTRENEHFAIAPQSLYEMYVVATRPTPENGLGWSAAQAHDEITKARTLFQLLGETTHVYHTWEALVLKYGVMGKPAHDARLVAMMIEHRVGQILTFNDQDYHRYAEVQAISTFDVLGIKRV